MVCPVINAASSLVQKRIWPVISSGSPNRLIACCSQVARFCSSDWGAIASVIRQTRQDRVRSDAIACNIMRQQPHEPDDSHLCGDVVAYAGYGQADHV